MESSKNNNKQKKGTPSRALVKFIKPKNVESVIIGDVILCKMRGYAEWPARVITVEKNRITVQFFGDHQTHTTTIKNIFNFANSTDVILRNINGRKGPMYAKSVREAEVLLGIDSKDSILNQ